MLLDLSQECVAVHSNKNNGGVTKNVLQLLYSYKNNGGVTINVLQLLYSYKNNGGVTKNVFHPFYQYRSITDPIKFSVWENISALQLDGNVSDYLVDLGHFLGQESHDFPRFLPLGGI